MRYAPEPDEDEPTKVWHSYTFKCLEGRDDDLIAILEEKKQSRGNVSNLIRRKLRVGLRLPDVPETEALTLDDLRTELNRIIEVVQNTTFVEIAQVPAGEQAKRQDVNDNGTRIPRF